MSRSVRDHRLPLTSRYMITPHRQHLLHHLPPELLDLVAFSIEDARDVLAFALTCRVFKTVAIPLHLDYRTICCRVSCNAVWQHLAEHSSRAARIRTVHLLEISESSRNHEKVPATLVPHLYESRKATAQDLVLAAEAIDKMDQLREFRWSVTSLSFSARDRTAELRVWKAVSQHTSLRHLEVEHNPRLRETEAGIIHLLLQLDPTFPLWSISNLTTIKLNNASCFHRQLVPQFTRVLKQSPSLETLHLTTSSSSFDLSTLLSGCTFPCLRDLALHIPANPPQNAAALACLLEQTFALETLHWSSFCLRPLRAGSLPALKRVSINAMQEDSSCLDLHIFADDTLPSRRLEEIRGIYLNSTSITSLKTLDFESLRRLDLVGFENMDLILEAARLFPRLTWFSVPSRDYMHDHFGVTKHPIHMAQWRSIFDLLPELEVFHGVSLFKDPLQVSVIDNDERARTISSEFPSLRRLDHWDMDPSKVIVLEKDSGGGTTWRIVDVED